MSMLDNAKLYPAYKDSGVPWLGKLPAHWEIPRLGAVLRERGEINKEGLVTDVLSVTKDRGVIPYAEKGNVGNKKSDDITRYKIVRPDDIVVNCMNVVIGSVGLSRYTGCLSPVYYVLTRRSQTDDARYLNAYFQAKPFQRSLVRIGNGILAHRMRVPMELMKCEPFPRPPADEQVAIVRFLDHADRRIQRYIHTKQKLIKLLEEQKQAIIHRAVTRGLDPDVRLKPAGVEWLGDVPEHWSILNIRHFARVGNGSTPSRARTDYWSGGSFPWLNSSVVNHPVINGADQHVTQVALGECHLPVLSSGCVLVAITGQGKTRGKAALLAIEATINQHLAYIAIRGSGVLATFLLATLTAAYPALRSISDDSGSTKGALTCADLRHFKVPVPPVSEQQELVEWIDGQTSALSRAMTYAQREIDLLGEYRIRLIAEVVTGKLDVREAASQFPDEDESRDTADAETLADEAEDEEDKADDPDLVLEETEL